MDLGNLTITKAKLRKEHTFKCKLENDNRIKVDDLLQELWWVRLEQDLEAEKKLLKKITDVMCENFEIANQRAVSALNSGLNRYAN